MPLLTNPDHGGDEKGVVAVQKVLDVWRRSDVVPAAELDAAVRIAASAPRRATTPPLMGSSGQASTVSSVSAGPPQSHPVSLLPTPIAVTASPLLPPPTPTGSVTGSGPGLLSKPVVAVNALPPRLYVLPFELVSYHHSSCWMTFPYSCDDVTATTASSCLYLTWMRRCCTWHHFPVASTALQTASLRKPAAWLARTLRTLFSNCLMITCTFAVVLLMLMLLFLVVRAFVVGFTYERGL